MTNRQRGFTDSLDGRLAVLRVPYQVAPLVGFVIIPPLLKQLAIPTLITCPENSGGTTALVTLIVVLGARVASRTMAWPIPEVCDVLVAGADDARVLRSARASEPLETPARAESGRRTERRQWGRNRNDGSRPHLGATALITGL